MEVGMFRHCMGRMEVEGGWGWGVDTALERQIFITLRDTT